MRSSERRRVVAARWDEGFLWLWWREKNIGEMGSCLSGEENHER